MKKLIPSLFTLYFVLSAVLLPIAEVHAFEFDPNNIISDIELDDSGSMTLNQIQAFLDTQNGVLKRLTIADAFGVERTAAEIVYNASQAYIINPQILLVKLQKEQSLITNPKPSQYNIDWAMGYGVCDSCKVTDPRVQLFKGFGKQVDRAAWRLRYYITHADEFNFAVGEPRLVDGIEVTPENRATVALYNYTPHIHGNLNFFKIWNRWFQKIYPDGTLVQQEGDDGVWLIENQKRRPIWSKAVLQSRFDASKILTVSRNDLNRYAVGFPIKFPNYSLLKDSQENIYLLVNAEKKKIQDQETFRTLGYHPEEVYEVTDEELAYYETGREITITSLYPTGALLQDAETGGVYYVEDGIKNPVWSREVMKINYPNLKITQVSPEELANYPTGTGVKLREGTLLKTADNPDVFVVSNGKLRRIANEQTFVSLGYNWHNIVTTSNKVFALHGKGHELDITVDAEAPEVVLTTK